jgi:serine/threonine-protein kinase
MKHVRDPLPDVQALRPEISAALAAIVERSTAKETRNRYADAAEMVEDLEQALAIEAARAGATNGEATSVLRALPADSARIAPRRLVRRRPLWLGIATMLLAAAAVAAVLLLTTRGDGGNGGKKAVAPVAAPPRPVTLLAAKDFDPPPGGGEEHAPEARNAIDHDPATAWSTETYSGGNLGKPGVGLYVTAESPVAARRLEVISKTPGFSARIYAAPTPSPTLAGWGQPIGTLRGVAKETVTLRAPAGKAFRSYLIWITKLPAAGQVQLNEVRLLG